MGIARGAIALLLEEAHKRPFHGRLATMGRQTIYATADDIARQFVKFGVNPKGAIDPRAASISDEDVFKWMGFARVESFDYSDFENATHVVDLNKEPPLVPDLTGAFDVVLDSGTLEHVFHFPNALKNTLSLLKVGGRMIFLTVSSNHLDHGFYMFSPTLFADYFAANGFRIETIYVVRYHSDMNRLWDAYEYQPGLWRNLHTGGLDDKPYAIWVVATRLEGSTLDAVPQQGYYADEWNAFVQAQGANENSTVKEAPPGSGPSASAGPVSPLRRIVRQIPGARSAWRKARPAISRIKNELCGWGVPDWPIPRQKIFRDKFIGKY